MFDLRYHVASLAAVFLMLVVGILIGVGISGPWLRRRRRAQAAEGKIAGLEEDVEAANANADDFEQRQEAAEMPRRERLPGARGRPAAGKNIAILGLGPVDPTVNSVERAIEEDADGRVSRMRALELPLRVEAVEAALSGKPELGGYVGDEQLGNLGRDLGRELAAGGATPLWDALEPEIVEVRGGRVRTSPSTASSSRAPPNHRRPRARASRGPLPGAGQCRRPGRRRRPERGRAERDPDLPALPPLDRRRVDTPVGALAMLLVLADPDAGDYGVRDTADRILPPIEPLSAAGG